MLSIPEELLAELKNAVEALGFELWGGEIINTRYRQVLRVYIDILGGVTVEDCALVSRQVAAALSAAHSPYAKYTLEVSSPGLDRLLFSLAQFRRMLGHKVQVRLRKKTREQRNFRGVLQTVDEQTSTFQLNCEGNLITIDYAQVERAQIVPEV